jgi:hypothetical protein
MDTSLLNRTFQCWNSPYEIEAGSFVHLSARAKWIDGRTIVIAKKVKNASIVEAPYIRCDVALDGEWITIVAYGPGTIPARAKVEVQIEADIATAMWLIEMKTAEKIAEGKLL